MTKPTTTKARTVNPMANFFLEVVDIPVPAASEDDGPAVEDDATGNTAGAPVLVALLRVNVGDTSADACDSVASIVILLVAVVDESRLDAAVDDVVGLAAKLGVATAKLELEVAAEPVGIDELMTDLYSE